MPDAWLLQLEEWGLISLMVAVFCVPLLHARLVAWRGASAKRLERLEQVDGWFSLVPAGELRRWLDGDAGQASIGRQLLRDLRIPGTAILPIGIALLALIGIWTGSIVLLLQVAVGAVVYAWFMAKTLRFLRHARMVRVRVTSLTTPHWGHIAIANRGAEPGDGYSVAWDPCAVLMMRGSVEALVLSSEDGTEGHAIGLRPLPA